MKRRLTEHGLWPGERTRLLLRAALLHGDAAKGAFAAWSEQVGSVASADELDPADRRLLPLVAANLERLGVTLPFASACAAVRRRTEEYVGKLLEATAEVVATLHDAGVPTLVLKGIPLVVEHYRELGLRPMADTDILVHPCDAERALAALHRDGWIAPHGLAPEGLRPYLCGHDLQRDRARLDLHQYLIEYGSSPEIEEGMWQRSHALEIGGAWTRAPGATDLLLHVCLASLKPGKSVNSRWIADAALVIASGRVDWDLLVREAERRRTVIPLGECLQCLVDTIDAPVPAAVFVALAQARVHPMERLVYRAMTRPQHTLPQLLEWHLTQYLFGARAMGARPGPVGFLSFVTLWMQSRWHLPSRWAIPRRALTALTRRARATAPPR